MNMKKILLTAGGVIIASAALFGACSSGGGGGGASQLTGPNVSRGVITGFGSVIVNGIHFDVSSADVTIDDSPSDESSLRIGMEVTVRGNGTSASSITAADDLEGPIGGIDAVAKSFSVMGQTVQTDNQTRFEGTAGLTALDQGNIVEVSGLADSTGVIHATRVELKTAATDSSTEIEVKGTVSNIDSAGKTFKLNALTVDFANATMKDFGAGGMSNGQFVEVKSTLGNMTGSTLTAETVELEPGLDAAEDEHVEIKGYITDYVSNGSFKVNGMTVDASGLSVAGLANDVEVEVEGTANAAGVLVAVKVELEQENENENDGPDDNSGQ